MASFFGFSRETVSHRLVGVDPDDITAFGIEVFRGIAVGVGASAVLGFSFCLDLSRLPVCR